MKPLRLNQLEVPKAWGGERIICNNEEFCGKILTIRKGAKFSMHFHARKREVFYVLKGLVIVRLLDTADASGWQFTFEPGQAIEIPRLQPHQIEALEDSEIIEFSTHHEDADSYRVAPGNSQNATPS